MAQFEQHFVQDLTQPIKVRHCGTLVFNADDESNVISVRLFNGSEPVAISGSVVGAVVCSDGATVSLTGSYSGNTASITLTGDCFAVLGQIGVGIQIVNGTQKTTVLKAIYNVETLTTENVVDPGSRITLEVGDLIAAIDEAVASIPEDYSALTSEVEGIKAVNKIFNRDVVGVPNPIDTATWIDNANLNDSGATKAAQGWKVTQGYIETSADSYKISYNNSETSYIVQVAGFTSDGSFVRMFANADTSSGVRSFTVDTTSVDKIRIATRYGNPILSVYPNDGKIVEKLASVEDDVSDLKGALMYTEKHGQNLWDPNDTVAGYINNSGNFTPDEGFRTSAYYIPVSAGDIVLPVVNKEFVDVLITCYDTNKNFLVREVGGQTGYTVAESGFIRPRIDTSISPGFMVQIQHAVPTIAPAFEHYANVLVNPDNTVYGGCLYVGSARTSGDNCFTQLKPCCDFIVKNNIKNVIVYVDAGTYDLRSEFDMRILNAIVSDGTNTAYGLKVGNNTHFVFAEGATLKFLYDGTSVACSELFSVFNIVGSCIIENANIEVANARYCVHEDLPSATGVIPDHYTVKYLNCVMKHNGNNMGTYTGTVCIGAGTMKNSLSIIDGGMYTCGTQFPWAISYHNFSKTTHGNYPSRVVLKNVWINNGLRLGTHGDSVVDVEITGCKMPSGIREYDTQYFNVTEWNNAIN